MRKIMKLGVCGLAVMILAAGCSKQKTTDPAISSKETEAVSETKAEPENKGTVTLGEYKGVEVSRQVLEVTDEELDVEIKRVLDSNPDTEEITDRVAQNGDIVNIDYVGKKDGTAFEGGTDQGFDLTLGSGSFIDGFEEGLVGAAVGESRNLDLTFPADYGSAELAGAAVVFEVKVNAIKVEKDAVLNDDFVKKVSQYQTVDEFRQGTKDEILAGKTANAKDQKEYEALMAVINNSQFEINEEMLEYRYNEQLDYYTNQVTAYGMDLETYATMAGMTLDQFKEQLRSSADNFIKQELVIGAIAEKEGITITDEDREEVGKLYGTDAATLIEQSGQEAVDDYAKMLKVLKFISDNAVEVDVVAETLPETAPGETAEGSESAEETSSGAETAATQETTAN